MANMVCDSCGKCCINVSAPRRVLASQSCCYCGEMLGVGIAPLQVIKAGTILGELKDSKGTFKAFDPYATDGSQIAKGILYHDVCTNEAGNITNWAGVWGCGPNEVPMYICGKFDLRDVAEGDVGTINAARASGLPVREISGWLFLG